MMNAQKLSKYFHLKVSVGRIFTIYNKILAEDYSEIQSYSNHPVHILDESSNLNPSAFIPFCAFDGDMTVLSTHRDNFSFPLCSSFKQLILDGQLCYSADLSRATQERGISQGPAHGLTLFLDYNEDRMVGANTDEEVQGDADERLNQKHAMKKDVKIYINTLEPGTGLNSRF